MRKWRTALICIATSAVVGLLNPIGTRAEQPVEIDVVTSLTGGAAFIGQSAQLNLQVAEKIVNADGGIKGRPLHFLFHDDQTSPQIAVQITGDIVARGPAIFLGALLYGQCKAMAPLVQKSGPTMYCLSPSLEAKPGDYAFASFLPTTAIAETMLRYFRARGWHRIGEILTADAGGQTTEQAWDAVLKQPQFADMSIVDKEYFNATDVSITAQLEKLRSAKPDALAAYTTGAAIGTIFRGLKQGGLDLPVATSTGNLVYTVMKQFAAVVPNQLYFSAGAGSPAGRGLNLDPATLAQKARVDAVLKAAGTKPDFATEDVWDPAMIAVDALRQVGPDASAASVQNYILALAHYVGLSGIYDFQKHPMNGLGAENALVVRWDATQEAFTAMSQPGGNPIVQ